jgi:DNA-binding transcriptional LysR family regulator
MSVAAFGVIPHATARFRGAYPDVELLLKEVNSDEGLEAVRIGQLDLCLLHPPRTVDPTINIEPVWLEPLVAVLPPKHPLAETKPIGLQRLKSEPWVIPQREIASRLHDEVIAACAAAGFEPRVAQRTTRMTTTISMVAGGIGVALLPITAARLGIGGAVYRHLRPPPKTRIPVAFAWRQSQASPALANLMAVIRDAARNRIDDGK